MRSKKVVIKTKYGNIKVYFAPDIHHVKNANMRPEDELALKKNQVDLVELLGDHPEILQSLLDEWIERKVLTKPMVDRLTDTVNDRDRAREFLFLLTRRGEVLDQFLEFLSSQKTDDEESVVTKLATKIITSIECVRGSTQKSEETAAEVPNVLRNSSKRHFTDDDSPQTKRQAIANKPVIIIGEDAVSVGGVGGGINVFKGATVTLNGTLNIGGNNFRGPLNIRCINGETIISECQEEKKEEESIVESKWKPETYQQKLSMTEEEGKFFDNYIITEQDCAEISAHIGNGHFSLGTFLGFPNAWLTQNKHNHPYNIKGCIQNMLNSWRISSPGGGKASALFKANVDAGFAFFYPTIKEYLMSQPPILHTMDIN